MPSGSLSYDDIHANLLPHFQLLALHRCRTCNPDVGDLSVVFLTKREQQMLAMLTIIQESEYVAFHTATTVKLLSAALGG